MIRTNSKYLKINKSSPPVCAVVILMTLSLEMSPETSPLSSELKVDHCIFPSFYLVSICTNNVVLFYGAEVEYHNRVSLFDYKTKTSKTKTTK